MARKSRSRLADDKPKTKKAEAKKSRSDHLTPDQFFEFIDRVGAHQAEAETAGMELAAVYKDTDKLGIHRQAAKLFKRMDSKEEPQRNDMLRSFYRFVGWAIDTGRWEGLADLVDAAEQEAAPASPRAPAREADDSNTEREPRAEGAGDGASRAPAAAKAAAPEADWSPGDERPVEEQNKDLDGGGFTFAVGRAAGAAGDGPEKNPHPAKNASHKIWESGRLQGANESPAANEPAGDDPAAAAAAPAKPSRRKGGANGQAALH